MSPPLSSLPIKPLQRLQVNDGLLLTAENWRQAHDYHRQRQNIYYQSLYQAGIVSGLGVCLIEPPMEVASEYRDRRWLQLQPGIAIDGNGNPIVVPQSVLFRIASLPPTSGTLVVYLVISYVDPDRLQNQTHRQLVQETFRIDEKTTPPDNTEVEICRILLEPGEVELQPAVNVLHPEVNNLDLRHRRQAQIRALESVKATYLIDKNNKSPTTTVNLSYLVESLAALYPRMQGTVETINSLVDAYQSNCDLLYISYQEFLTFKNQTAEIENLRQYSATGATLLVEVSAQEANIIELNAVRQQLQTAIANLNQEPEIIEIRQELQTELDSVEVKISQQLSAICNLFSDLTEEKPSSHTIQSTMTCDRLLRTQPFLFAQLPSVQNQPIYLFNWGGIVLVVGSLSSAWGINDNLSLSRETIRTAQEMGINILHFAWRRHQLTQLTTNS